MENLEKIKEKIIEWKPAVADVWIHCWHRPIFLKSLNEISSERRSGCRSSPWISQGGNASIGKHPHSFPSYERASCWGAQTRRQFQDPLRERMRQHFFSGTLLSPNLARDVLGPKAYLRVHVGVAYRPCLGERMFVRLQEFLELLWGRRPDAR